MRTEIKLEPNFSFTRPQPLFELPSNTLRVVDITPDDKDAIIELGENVSASVTQMNIVVGWFEELKQKFNAGKK
jgi:hypothetical protein